MEKKHLETLLEKMESKVIAFRPLLARACGGVNAALFLQQFIFWSGKEMRGDGFIFKTKEEIESETTLTAKQQDTIRPRLIDMGILKTMQARVYGSPVLHYKVDFDRLCSVLIEHSQRCGYTIHREQLEKLLIQKDKKITTSLQRKLVKKILKHWKTMCRKELGVEPVEDIKAYKIVEFALGPKCKMSEKEIYELFDWRMMQDVPLEELVQVTRALSGNSINNFRVSDC